MNALQSLPEYEIFIYTFLSFSQPNLPFLIAEILALAS